MPLVTWNDGLSVGVAILDDDHKKMLEMINAIHEGLRMGQGPEVLGEILERLVDYTQNHFRREEEFFAESRYAGTVIHKKQHSDLTERVLEVRRRYRAGSNTALTLEVMNFLCDWLVDHIQGSDKKYASYFNYKGIY